MWQSVFVAYFMKSVLCSIDVNRYYSSPSKYVFWPNATVPFYVNPEHFDNEQSLSIMATLALFAFRSCLKFVPVLTPPGDGRHVLTFENPRGIRKCVMTTTGHAKEEPHRITLGYECLRSPQIDMVVMKALGLPFEHNRNSRDIYIDVQYENIEPNAVHLFTKDPALPMELQSLPYDFDSVMHFGAREYSKNGHRTIIFKDIKRTQNRYGLTATDLKKLDIVYGSECRKRDRQEKVELCQRYPGVARKKRELEQVQEYHYNANLRVNRDITPPPTKTGDITPPPKKTEDITLPPNKPADDKTNVLSELDIEDEVQGLIDQVYKVSSKALRNARAKHCDLNKTPLRDGEGELTSNNTRPDVVGIIDSVTNYAKSMVERAVSNLTAFCVASENVEVYQRYRCSSFYAGRSCPETYRSTKHGPVAYSTRHRPAYYQSTKTVGGAHHNKQYLAPLRSSNATENATTANNTTEKRTVENGGTLTTPLATDVALHTNGNGQAVMKLEGVEDTTTVSKKADRRKRSAGTTVKSQAGDSIDAAKSENGKSVKVHRRRFTPTRSSGESNWDHSQVSLENVATGDRRYKIHRPRYVLKKYSKTQPKSKKVARQSSQASTEELREDDSPELKTVKLSKENEEFYTDRRWPGGFVRYIIQDDPNYDSEDVRKRIEEVNSILLDKTCVKLQELTESEANNYEDYLVIDTSADYVTGRVGGRQNFGCLELFRGGQHRQHAAMMVMAMLGFYFEIARHDRDKYIRVHLRHVRPDKLHHFEKIRSDATLPLPYDYTSATHPAWQFWRKLGTKGISSVATYKSLDPEGDIMKSLGQNRELLSDLDLVKINSVYGTKCFTRGKGQRTF